MIEPLCDFHKDEVRALGMDLGLPRQLVYRHPFPGVSRETPLSPTAVFHSPPRRPGTGDPYNMPDGGVHS